MSWTLCTSGSAITKAGLNANPVIVLSGSALSNWSDEAESLICGIARVNTITAFSTMPSAGKYIATQYCTASIAQNIANYEPSAYSPAEFSNIINVLENQKGEVRKLLSDDKVRKYLGLT